MQETRKKSYAYLATNSTSIEAVEAIQDSADKEQQFQDDVRRPTKEIQSLQWSGKWSIKKKKEAWIMKDGRIFF